MTTEAQKKAMTKYNAKRRARYWAQPPEHREQFTLLGKPRKIINHKKQYGESLEQMGKRLGISREAVRRRILLWGSPEHSAEPIKVPGERTYTSPTSFISARKLRCWGYDSLAQLAQQSDNEILGLYHMSPRLLKMLRALYPKHTAEAALGKKI